MISDVYDAMCHAFERYGCPIPIYLGPQFLAQHTPTSRVVMFQSTDKFKPPSPASLTPTQRLQYINPRPVATRSCGLNAELWVTAPPQANAQNQYRADLAYLDALVNQFCVALQQLVSGLFDLEGGVCAPNNGAAARAGLGYLLSCSIDIPIIDAAWPAQQLGECSKTWAYAPATAEIEIAKQTGYNPPEFQPEPPFTLPTPE